MENLWRPEIGVVELFWVNVSGNFKFFSSYFIYLSIYVLMLVFYLFIFTA